MVTRYARWSGVLGSVTRVLIAVAAVGFAAGVAGAQPEITTESAASDLAGGYVVLPKVRVHTINSPSDPALPGEVATDTLVQITNTNDDPTATNGGMISVHCWWVNANGHCGGAGGTVCYSNADCAPGLSCEFGCETEDFRFSLTRGQPVAFLASSGLSTLPCDPTDVGPGCIAGQDISGSSILGVPEDPFLGELKCVQVNDLNDVFPVVANDLKVEASIISTTVPGGAPGSPEVTNAAAYNGIGFQALSGAGTPAYEPLCLGTAPATVTCGVQYVPCPAVLILNHFFDGAEPEIGGVVETELTLVPCSENMTSPSAQASVTAQMLVYNEFEQRFSTSSRVDCYQNTRLSDIDTAAGEGGDSFSIFAAGVQGTMVGQTRIRGVQGLSDTYGYGLLAVATENYRAVGASALTDPVLSTTGFNVHETGFRTSGDMVYIEP